MIVNIERINLSYLSSSSFCFQLNVQAQDLGDPPLASTAQVTVNIIRNSFGPEFSPASYSENIDFDISVNQEITTVTAQDRDRNVSPDRHLGAVS